MTAFAVHWHEGMFLRPQHLQAGHRHVLDLIQTSAALDHHYYWGLREFVYDHDALRNHQLIIRRLRGRLRDGTCIDVANGQLPAIDVKPLLEQGPADIFIGVANVSESHANVAQGPGDVSRRFLLENFDLRDENTGLKPQSIQLRRLNVRLLLPGQDHAGYEVLPLVRLVASSEADAAPLVFSPYIPALLACDAWPPLLNDILERAYQRMGRKIDLLADQMLSRGISLESQAHGDSLIIDQLRVLNEANALFKVLLFARGVHPFVAYAELCRLIGQLAIFGEARRTPDLPNYDHDDLGGCFHAVIRHLDTLLNCIVEPSYKFRHFVGAGKRMQVALDPIWLEANQQLYVGVKSQLPAEQSMRILTSKSFDMKIGSAGEVDRIFERGSAGLRFTATPNPPRVLPNAQGLGYVQVNRDSPEWDNVRSSLTLAIRLKEDLIVGTIQDQRTLNLKVSSTQIVTMEFTLYVVEVQP
jgi:type VI secretion system protein ImpJ